MPITHFVCPDRDLVPTKYCLQGCRCANDLPAGRCLSARTLALIAEDREWTGVPSTTMLLNGTRETYLKITNGYAVNPLDRMFMVHGTRGHANLEAFTPEGTLSEIRLFGDDSSGQFDFYDNRILYDNKFYGSYAVAKTIGIEKAKVPDGLYKNGKPKFKSVFTEGRKDRFNLAVQLNDYRVKLEAAGYPVDKMMCEIIVRDGNTYIAKSRGVMLPAYLIEVNKISDRWINRYMAKKNADLQFALSTGIIPAPCKPKERWAGDTGSRKCQSYCEVADICSVGIREKAMMTKEDTDD